MNFQLYSLLKQDQDEDFLIRDNNSRKTTATRKNLEKRNLQSLLLSYAFEELQEAKDSLENWRNEKENELKEITSRNEELENDLRRKIAFLSLKMQESSIKTDLNFNLKGGEDSPKNKHHFPNH
eukprot:Sdes_comp8876_c0_seq1m269